MTKLVWDKVDDRLYKTGLDRGVLYVPDAQREYSNGFAWNGLTAIDEFFSDDKTDPYYFDGVKYLDSYNNGDFEARLSAFTYPDEFLEFEGMGALGSGLYVDDQASKVFGLAYRTLVGNMIEGVDYGYRIHLLYNLTAVPGTLTFQNGSNPSEPVNFEWVISAVPEKAVPYRPTAHIIIDSIFLNPDILEALEDILYGTDIEIIDGEIPPSAGTGLIDGGTPSSDEDEVLDGDVIVGGNQPRLPSLEELLGFVASWAPKLIVPAPTTGLSELAPGVGDLTQAHVLGLYVALPSTRLVKTDPDGFYLLNG